jgi:hypothetical protein
VETYKSLDEGERRKRRRRRGRKKEKRRDATDTGKRMGDLQNLNSPRG